MLQVRIRFSLGYCPLHSTLQDFYNKNPVTQNLHDKFAKAEKKSTAPEAKKPEEVAVCGLRKSSCFLKKQMN